MGLGVAIACALTLAALGVVAGAVDVVGAPPAVAHLGYALCAAGAGLSMKLTSPS